MSVTQLSVRARGRLTHYRAAVAAGIVGLFLPLAAYSGVAEFDRRSARAASASGAEIRAGTAHDRVDDGAVAVRRLDRYVVIVPGLAILAV